MDIDPRFKPDLVADVRALPLRPFHADVLWASPPCQDFSKWGLRCFYPNPPEPDLSIAHAVKGAIAAFAPLFWVVENVWASRLWLTKLFGPVRALPLGHALWSNLGFLLPPIAAHKGGHWMRKRTRDWYLRRGLTPVGTGHNGMSSAEAAKIPYEIGEAICRAVESRRA